MTNIQLTLCRVNNGQCIMYYTDSTVRYCQYQFPCQTWGQLHEKVIYYYYLKITSITITITITC